MKANTKRAVIIAGLVATSILITSCGGEQKTTTTQKDNTSNVEQVKDDKMMMDGKHMDDKAMMDKKMDDKMMMDKKMDDKMMMDKKMDDKMMMDKKMDDKMMMDKKMDDKMMMDKKMDDKMMMDKKMDDKMMMDKMTAGMYVDYSAEKLAAAKGTKVLFFHAKWCPSCLATDKNISNETVEKGLNIFKVDFDSSLALRQKYGVTSQHTFVQVDDAGNMLKKWNSSKNTADILKNLKK